LKSQIPNPKSSSPPPAVAPFDARKAKAHQEGWAKHLGVPVEIANSIGMKLALIPPGEFTMGSADEEIAAEIERAKGDKGRMSAEGPSHRVKITKPFYLAIYPVTQGEFEKVMDADPSAFTEKQMDASAFTPPLSEGEVKSRLNVRKKLAGKETSRHPVETVHWLEAIEFCRRLSAIPAERAARRVYRLPTEAEWEYSARAGTTTRWCCGDDEADLQQFAWFNKNAGGMTHPVGEKKPNAWGLCDMHGNVYQWCADWFGADYYQHSPPSDPAGPAAGSDRVMRGGSWSFNSSDCRSAHRFGAARAHRTRNIGFRVVVAD
jgi:formylglycine-generating enzyme required for sulfatase activity